MKLLLEAIPLVIIIASGLYGVANLSRLPQQVAIHFNAQGQPDNWMSRNAAIWLAPGFALLFYIALTLVERRLYFHSSIYIWKLLLVILMANVQVVTVLYSSGKLRAPLLGIFPALALMLVYGIWQLAMIMISQTKV